ncbi:hypothetical protein VOLCADRAFT_87364, partial [Volvox carteri f. nagariensis]
SYIKTGDSAVGRAAQEPRLFNNLHSKGGATPAETFVEAQMRAAYYRKSSALQSRAMRKAGLRAAEPKPPAQRDFGFQDSRGPCAPNEASRERATCPPATTKTQRPLAVAAPGSSERHTYPRATVSQPPRPRESTSTSERDWNGSPSPSPAAGADKLGVDIGQLFPAPQGFASQSPQLLQRPAAAPLFSATEAFFPVPRSPETPRHSFPSNTRPRQSPDSQAAEQQQQQQGQEQRTSLQQQQQGHQQQQGQLSQQQEQVHHQQQRTRCDSALPLDEGMAMEMAEVGDGLLFLAMDAPLSLLPPDGIWSCRAYRVTHQLHRGYASCVYKAICRWSGSDVVLKAYHLAGLSDFLLYQVLRELDIHSRQRHEGVVKLLAAFKEGDTLVMVLEYAGGGSACRVRRKLGGRMSEFQAMHLVLLPLLGVLSHLHEQGIVHRDIKPENLLFTESWQLKLCDFGVSICLREERAVTRTGSREYMAPEVSICPLKHLPEDNKDNLSLAYTSAVDVWSLGSLMYELLVGFTPFPGGPPPRREGARGSAGAALAFPTGVSQAARAFVRDCLQLEPEDRPTVHKLLEHAWDFPGEESC